MCESFVRVVQASVEVMVVNYSNVGLSWAFSNTLFHLSFTSTLWDSQHNPRYTGQESETPGFGETCPSLMNLSRCWNPAFLALGPVFAPLTPKTWPRPAFYPILSHLFYTLVAIFHVLPGDFFRALRQELSVGSPEVTGISESAQDYTVIQQQKNNRTLFSVSPACISLILFKRTLHN